MNSQWRKKELYGAAGLITTTLFLVILAGVLWTKIYWRNFEPFPGREGRCQVIL